jgi:DNA-binding CsgD family transcriptional regulator
MSVGAALPGGERLALVVHRDVADSRDFDANEESFARSLAPHLQQVFRVDGQLRTAHAYIQELETGIDSVRCGLVLCEADGRVRWANRAARSLLGSHPLLSTSAERLMASSATGTTRLRKMIADVARDERNQGMRPDRIMVFREEATAEPLHIVLQKVTQPHDNGAGAASPAPDRVLVMLSSAGVAPALPASLIGALFALSPAESRLTAALCHGQTVEQYAQTAGVTVGTARFQLNQVLAKVQVKRQSELIRKVYSSVIAQALLRSH